MRNSIHTLLIINPGHFHAALTLKEPHPAISNEVYVYAPRGQELEQFLSIVESFNQKPEDPTAWKLHVYRGEDYLDTAIRERKGDIVILAGRNDLRMGMIHRLHSEGFHVLADKPWLISHKQAGLLKKTLSKSQPIVIDIMTSRHQVSNRIRKTLTQDRHVFGELLVPTDGTPSFNMESVHCVSKTVNGKPLVRPTWHFDIKVQGKGIVDILSHLVDIAHWTLFPDQVINYERDVAIKQVKSWTTKIPLETFKRVTGYLFTEPLQEYVTDNVLEHECNCSIEYTVKDIPIHVRSTWILESLQGGGDAHHSLIRGTLSDLITRQLHERGYKHELVVKPRDMRHAGEIDKALGKVLKELEDTIPGVTRSIQGDEFIINIPPEHETGHEEHFAQVFNQFIKYIESGKLPSEENPNTVTKYILLAEAQKNEQQKKPSKQQKKEQTS
jgi:predicted dehydrogenase